ncbi:MAG TPA: CapA family protein [Tissierellia bacterium]|nr:CapA family protein [Tissierellia bacterium]
MRLIALVFLIIVLIVALVMVDGKNDNGPSADEVVDVTEVEPPEEESGEATPEPEVDTTVRTAKIMASGDILYHLQVYLSGYDPETGSYDYHENYEYIKPLISSADLAIGDFEGTISPDFPLAGYPIFNAPPEVVPAIKDAGYDAMSLAHNHILDSHLPGLFSTAQAFRDGGIDVFGVQTGEEDILIKDVNGIKVALLGYVYGFNGMESLLTQEEYDAHLKDLDPERMRSEIERAEELADVTIIMPQMGNEYWLEPTQEQIDTYHQMIEWGADIIFGGHPHVVQPTEIVQKDGYDKFIIYSMGNLISNQRIETVDDVWTERGVIPEVNLKKVGDGPVVIESIIPHVTWVDRTPNGLYSPEGYELFLYQTYLTADFIEGGQYSDRVDEVTRQRITEAHHGVLELLDLQPLTGLKE